MVFTGIRFSCSGTITKWTFLARERPGGERYPELQVWSRDIDHGITYRRKNESSAANARLKSPFIYESLLSVPLAFEPGDVLGLYQPNVTSSKLVSQYQDEDGIGETLRLEISSSASSINTEDMAVLDRQKLHPLLAIEQGKSV